MSLTDVKVGGNKREYPLPKKGMRLAILSGIIDVGIQAREFQGVAKAPARQVIFRYTLVNDHFVNDEGKKQHLTVNVGPFTLAPGNDKGKYMVHVKALDPEAQVLSKDGAGNVTKLLGRPAYLNIGYSDPKGPEGKVYANAVSASPIPEDVTVPPTPYEAFLFDCSKATEEDAAKLSGYQIDCIRKSKGYTGSALESTIEATVKARADKKEAHSAAPAVSTVAEVANDIESPI